MHVDAMRQNGGPSALATTQAEDDDEADQRPRDAKKVNNVP